MHNWHAQLQYYYVSLTKQKEIKNIKLDEKNLNSVNLKTLLQEIKEGGMNEKQSMFIDWVN